MIRSTESTPEVTGETLLHIGEPITDPDVTANFRLQMEQFARNSAWFEAHAEQIGREQPGKFISVVAGELFVGDDVRELYARVRAAHPAGWNAAFTKHIRPRLTA